MSHYFVGVLVQPENPTPDAIGQAVIKALEPFNENTTVDPYQRPCYCVGGAARSAAHDAAEAFHPLAAYRAQLAAEFAHLSPIERFESKAVDRRWEALIAPYKAIQRETFETHPAKEAADPTCESCQGTGSYESTYNPKSKWNWYAIGGRWTDVLGPTDQPGPWQDPALRGNCLPVRAIDPTAAAQFFAVVDPLGKWNSTGDMGRFGLHDDDHQWPAKRAMILAEFPDAICVGMDLHI